MQMGSRPNGESSENARHERISSETNPEGCPGRGKSALDTRADLMTLADTGRSELLAAGLIKSLRYPIKILADGELNHPLSVKVNKFSASAKAKIEAVGGKAEEVGHAAEAK